MCGSGAGASSESGTGRIGDLRLGYPTDVYEILKIVLCAYALGTNKNKIYLLCMSAKQKYI